LTSPDHLVGPIINAMLVTTTDQPTLLDHI